MADISSIANIRYFNIYDKDTSLLKYSKYNFDFDKYSKDYDLTDKSKLDIFDDFLIRNETAFQTEPDYDNIPEGYTPSYLKPTVLKEGHEKYFLPITNEMIQYNNKYAQTVHPGYMNIQDPRSYASIFTLVTNQFDLVFYKNDEIRRLQDYYFSDDDGIFSKYNFDFSQYSNDFNVYGNNLLIFTDFISRVVYSSGSFIGAYGYGVPKGFKKYFFQQEGLIDYMSKYGTTSIWENVCFKNEYNIDYLEYAKDNNLPTDNLENSKEHFLRWGQFKQLEIKFNEQKLTSIEKNINSVCNIFTSKQNGSGFLYKNKDDDPSIYVVTCSHIIDSTNLTTFRATFGISSNNRNNNTQTAEFRVMGRDLFTDIMIGVYDPELPYNKAFEPDLSGYKPLRINLISPYKIGESVYSAGSLELNDNNTLLTGKIMDPYYSGDFYPQSTYIPESMLINFIGTGGMSGAPIFKEASDSEVCGMIVGSIKNGIYTVGLSSFILENLLTNIIARWDIFSKLYKNDPVKLQYFTKNSVTKKWLGAVTSYYHPKYSTSQNLKLANFPYTGGLILHDFILGFDFIHSCYIFDSDTLTREGTTQIKGPLLRSKMYNRFVDSAKTPIVLKSAAFLNGLTGQYAKYNFGKFSNQDAFWQLTYGLSPIGYFDSPEGSSNALTPLFGKIYFEYYYYNGKEWELDTEEVGGSTSDWYLNYKDALGNKYYQSYWEFPQILLNYTESYIYKLDNPSQKGNGLFGTLGKSKNHSGVMGSLGSTMGSTFGSAMGSTFGSAMGSTFTSGNDAGAFSGDYNVSNVNPEQSNSGSNPTGNFWSLFK